MENSAGILPISKNEHGDVVFLIGKDSRDGVFSDFGGKAELIDNGDPINTATREFYEETLGCICNSPYSIRERVKQMSVMVNGTTKKGNLYRMFILEIPYASDLPLRFKKIVNFLKYKNIGSAYIEKSEIAWVSLDDMLKIPKRQVFSDTVSNNLSVLKKIISSPWRSICEELKSDIPLTLTGKSPPRDTSNPIYQHPHANRL